MFGGKIYLEITWDHFFFAVAKGLIRGVTNASRGGHGWRDLARETGRVGPEQRLHHLFNIYLFFLLFCATVALDYIRWLMQVIGDGREEEGREKPFFFAGRSSTDCVPPREKKNKLLVILWGTRYILLQ